MVLNVGIDLSVPGDGDVPGDIQGVAVGPQIIAGKFSYIVSGRGPGDLY
ncbi:hypothetical protein [Arthrobacter sp. lap29]|nr:hypothetical protein [Arthrobacter sp. lap29]